MRRTNDTRSAKSCAWPIRRHFSRTAAGSLACRSEAQVGELPGHSRGSFRELVVVADHARQLPRIALTLPQVDEFAGLGETIRLAGSQREETMRAHLHRAVISYDMYGHGVRYQFATRAEVGDDSLPLATARDVIDALAPG